MILTALQTGTSSSQNVATGVTVQSFTATAGRVLWPMIRLSGLNGAAAIFTVAIINTTDTKVVNSFTETKATTSHTAADLIGPAFVAEAKAYSIRISSSNASDTSVGVTVEWYDGAQAETIGIAANAITATAIASDAITAAKIASDAITAAKIATDAFTAAKFATDAGTEFATAVWAATTRLLTAGTNIQLPSPQAFNNTGQTTGMALTSAERAIFARMLNESVVYYVSAAGSDSNDGLTPSSAWLTISKVNAGTYGPGDTVKFRAGDTFSGTLALTTTNTSGTKEAPVVFTSYGGGISGRATISGGASSAVTSVNVAGYTLENLILTSTLGSLDGTTGAFGVVFASFNSSGRKEGITIRGCDISGGKQCIAFESDDVSALYGCNYILIEDCKLHDSRMYGFYVREVGEGDDFTHYSHVRLVRVEVFNIFGSSDSNLGATGSAIVLSRCDDSIPIAAVDGWDIGTEVVDCDLHDNGSMGTFDSGGVFGTSSTGVWVHRNKIQQDGDGSHPSGAINIGRDSNHWIYEHNLIYNCGHLGMSIDGPYAGGVVADQDNVPYNHTIRFNYFVNWGANVAFNQTAAISHSSQADNRSFYRASGQSIDIYNNAFIAPSTAFSTCLRTNADGFNIYNNIFLCPSWITVQYEIGKAPVLRGNQYWGNSNSANNGGGRMGLYNGSFVGTLAAAQALGFEAGTGVVADPLIAWDDSGFLNLPDAENLAEFTALSPQVGSLAFGGGIDIASTYGITIGFKDFNGLPPFKNIGASGYANTGPQSAFSRIGIAGAGLTALGDTRIANLDATMSSRLAPTTPGRTLDVSAGGEAGIDFANIGSPTTTVNLSGTTIKTATDVATSTAAIKAKTDNLPTTPASQGDVTTVGSAVATVATAQTTMLSRLGAFTGTGVNTVLGMFKALMNKSASVPSDVGGTFDPATDSVEANAEAIAAIDAGGGGGTGDGDTPVNHNTGGVDALQYSIDGEPADNVVIRAYLTEAYDDGDIDATPPTTYTGPDGRWLAPLMLNSGFDYTLVANIPGVSAAKVTEITVA